MNQKTRKPKPRFHCADEKSQRIASIRDMLLRRGIVGASTDEIGRSTGSRRVSSDVSELRECGKRGGHLVVPKSQYIGLSRNGRKIYRYWCFKNTTKKEGV